MKIFCAICMEHFTGSSGGSIVSTACGHVYHDPCLGEWMQRNKSCPHCRTTLTQSKVHKLNLIFEQELSMEEVQLDSLQFQLSLKTKEVQDIRKASKDMVSQNQQLKEFVKKLETERRGHTSVVGRLRDEILNLRTELKKRTEELLGRQVSGQSESPELIDIIDDSDIVLQEDIMAQLQNSPNRNNDSSTVMVHETENFDLLSENSNESIADLKEQLSLKDAMLSSALSRISYLEEILNLNNNFSS